MGRKRWRCRRRLRGCDADAGECGNERETLHDFPLVAVAAVKRLRRRAGGQVALTGWVVEVEELVPNG